MCGKANPFVPLFKFIEKIVMEVSTIKEVICEDNDERNYWNILFRPKYDIYYIVAHTQAHIREHMAHIRTHTHTYTQIGVYVCVCVYT